MKKASGEDWHVVDTKQKKGEKRKEREGERKRLQQQIEQERQRRRAEEERLSYSGWGPKDDPRDPHQNKSKKGATPSSKKQPQADFSSPFGAPTMYAALSGYSDDKKKLTKAEQQAAKQAAEEKKRAAAAAAAADAEAARKRKEKARKKKLKNKKKPSLSQLSASLDLETAKPFLLELSEKYPSKYDVQLMVLADFFESKFGKASLGPTKLLEEKTFARKLEIPYSYLDDDVVEALEEWLRGIPPAALVDFTLFLLNGIAKAENSHKTSGIGLRMLLSVIARNFRDVALSSTEHPSFAEKYLTDSVPDSAANILSQNSQLLKANSVPLMVWYLGQTIEDHPTLAFSLWVAYLQPHLFVSASEATRTSIIDFFNLLFIDGGKNVRDATPSDTATALERLAAYRESLSDSQLKKDPLNSMFLTIEHSIVWRNNPLVHNYFEVYLRRCASDNKSIQEEAQKKTLRALTVDRQGSPAVWHRIYPRYINETTHLINFLTDKWQKYVSVQDKSLLSPSNVAEAVHRILDTNEKIEKARYKIKVPSDEDETKKKNLKVQKEDVDACTAACRNLLQKTGAKVEVTPASRSSRVRDRTTHDGSSSSSGFLGTLMYLFLFLAVMTAIAVLYLRQSEPELYQELLRTGLAYYRSGLTQARVYSAEASVWLHKILDQAYVLKEQLQATMSAPKP